MIMLISPIAGIILGQRRTRRVSESPVFYPETDRMLIPAVIVDNPPSEVTRDSRDRSSGQEAIPAVLGKHSCFNLTTIVGQVGGFVRATQGLLRTFTTRGSPQRRLVHAFIAFIIGIQGFHSLTAYAAVNLIPNPSVESANSAGTMPLGWNAGKSGINTTTFTYKKDGGHNGSKSLYIKTSKLTSGDCQLVFHACDG